MSVRQTDRQTCCFYDLPTYQMLGQFCRRIKMQNCRRTDGLAPELRHGRTHATLFFCCCRRAINASVAAFGSQDLGFRTSTDRQTHGSAGPGPVGRTCTPVRCHKPMCVSLSDTGFGSEDLGFRASTLGFTLRTWVSGPRKLSILRSSYLFPVTFLCVQWSQTHERSEFIYKIVKEE